MKVYLGRVINPVNFRELEDFNPGFVAVDSCGRISNYGRWSYDTKKLFGNAEIVDYQPFTIIPGFVDTHLHLPQLDVRGMAGFELLTWLEKYIYPAEKAFVDPHRARNTAQRFFAELLRNGITTAAIYSSVHKEATDIAFKEAKIAGFRAIIGKVMMDTNAPSELLEDPVEAVDVSIELCEKWHGYDDRLFYAFTPRFAISCSERLLSISADAAEKYGAYIQTHLSESKKEVSVVRKLFSKYENYTAVYYETGILGSRTIVAHAIHLEELEFKLLAETKAKVSHCPSSNLFLHSGRMNLEKMDEYSVPVGLGSDIGAGPTLCVFEIMRNMYYLNIIDPTRAFFHATLGGAEVLGMEDIIGSFSDGKEADFVIVNPEPLVEPDAEVHVLLSQLMFRADDRNIVATYVKGKKLYSSGLKRDS